MNASISLLNESIGGKRLASVASSLLLIIGLSACANTSQSGPVEESHTNHNATGLDFPVPRNNPGDSSGPSTRANDPRAEGSFSNPSESGAESGPQSLLDEAEALYDEGAYTDALEACIEIARINPDTPGLQELRNRILSAMMEERAVNAAARDQLDRHRAMRDVDEKGRIPDTYGLRRMIGESAMDSIISESAMMQVLERPVDIHLKGASLSSLIHALSEDEDINMIADEGIGGGRTIDIHVTDVPLREVLSYIGRHFQIQFHTGENMIWVTEEAPDRSPPMETRVFRLRTGLLLHGQAWGELPEDIRLTQSDISGISRKATVLPDRGTYIEEVIEKFVPSVNGANLHVDYNSHTMFVRNTPENLKLIAQIVEALDVNPPQVLIEARFIEISHADLQEIGIDWILGSPLTVTQRGVQQDGVRSRQPATIIDEDSSITFSPFQSDDAGRVPLGPVGPFGLVRPGVPPTEDQGLNLHFRGVLTEPMFTAVLHALEISGKGRTLSAPRVTTLNNNPAKLRDGDDLLYYEEFEAQAFHMLDRRDERVTVTAMTPKGRPSMAELGFTLVAVPSVGADNRSISLLLTPTISELVEFISFQDDPPEEDLVEQRIRQVVVKLPRISRREVQTKVVVDSGETVVMGGLIRTVSQDTKHRVPVLGSLPLVGPLFRRTDVTEERRNLLIFVTATVISERGESLLPLTQRDTGPRAPGG